MDHPDSPLAANWVLGELFGLMNTSGQTIEDIRVSPAKFSRLLDHIQDDNINTATAKSVLAQIFMTGGEPDEIIKHNGLEQISDPEALVQIINQILETHPEEVAAYRAGKTALLGWFFGQVMQQTGGQANPELVKELLDQKL
jgi:Asp-tRNA(Asn)/Glu-tRNA(Gln) amidotransferase B subunit